MIGGRKKWVIASFMAACVWLAAGRTSFATIECADAWSSARGNFADAAFGYEAVAGGGDLAKFNEYRDITSGFSGAVGLNQSDGKSFVRLEADEIGRTDNCYNLTTGLYGTFKATLYSNELPHNFAYGAETLYDGAGTNHLTLPAGVQTFLQGSTSSANAATRLTSLIPDANSIDLALYRKTYGAAFEYTPTKEVTVNAGLSWENRTGDEPMFGSFGFSNTVELPEPIDYDTFDRNIGAEYAGDEMYLSANYAMSTFTDGNNDLIWANPFRDSDSTSAEAFASSYAAGSSSGMMSLDPDNRYENLSTTGAWRNLPGHGTLAVTSSWSWTQDDASLLPYTINSAIVPGAAGNPPFAADSLASLPSPSVNENVSTALINAYYNANPVSFIHLTGRFREYNYQNDTPITTFPGFVIADAVWSAGSISTVPTGFRDITDTFEAGFDLLPRTTLTLHYDNDDFDRTDNREAPHLDEDDYSASIDSFPVSWMDAHITYDKSRRGGLYDPFASTGGALNTSIFPYLVEYDEGDRDQFGTNALVSFFPSDSFTVSASLDNDKDIYFDSLFGLLNDARNSFSVDADYEATERLDFDASWDKEAYLNDQAARQWSPGGIGSPYVIPGYFSYSNWTAESLDRVGTVEGGLKFKLDPKSAVFQTHYSYSRELGSIDFNSPLGTAANDANPFVPLSFPNVDSSKLQTLDAHFTYTFPHERTLTVGWMWQRLGIDDYNYQGFTYVPVSLAGAYNGALLMGTLPQGYDVNVYYVTYGFHFY